VEHTKLRRCTSVKIWDGPRVLPVVLVLNSASNKYIVVVLVPHMLLSRGIGSDEPNTIRYPCSSTTPLMERLLPYAVAKYRTSIIPVLALCSYQANRQKTAFLLCGAYYCRPLSPFERAGLLLYRISFLSFTRDFLQNAWLLRLIAFGTVPENPFPCMPRPVLLGQSNH